MLGPLVSGYVHSNYPYPHISHGRRTKVYQSGISHVFGLQRTIVEMFVVEFRLEMDVQSRSYLGFRRDAVDIFGESSLTLMTQLSSSQIGRS